MIFEGHGHKDGNNIMMATMSRSKYDAEDGYRK